jgi:hypothetical protein
LDTSKNRLAVSDEPIVAERYKLDYAKSTRTEQIRSLNAINGYLQFVKERSGAAV